MKTRPFESSQETPNGSEVAETAELKKRVEKSKTPKRETDRTPPSCAVAKRRRLTG
ncbi:MAG: hypothetical protein IKK39_04530 [Thermoguttaceae bacterium]|nr:hypothetical protein [Thermoguttaceae bacterium]